MGACFIFNLPIPTFVFAKFLTRQTRRLTFILSRSFCHKTITCPFYYSTIIHNNYSISIYVLISWNLIYENLGKKFCSYVDQQERFKAIFIFDKSI